MKLKVPLYVISIVLAILGFPMVLILLYLEWFEVDISSRFFWVISIACCILSILSFSLGRILSLWEEEDSQE